MPQPTLLQKGKIKFPAGADKYEKIRANNMTAIDYIMEQLSARLNLGIGLNPNIRSWSDKILILEAYTGTGKTTTMAAEIYKRFYDKMGRTIINTLPLIAAVIRSTDEVAEIFNLTIGENIGFQTGSISKKPINGVLYAQVGVLLQQLKVMTAVEIMNKYSVIIIDEVHDRNITVDLVLYFLKQFLRENWDNPRCPHVIFMSATLDAKAFLTYFGEKKIKPQHIIVEGKSYPIHNHFLELPPGNYLNKVIATVTEIHTNNLDDFNNRTRDILIFVSGRGDTDKLIKSIKEENKKFVNKLYPVEFSGEVYRSGGKKLHVLTAPIETLMIDGVAAKRRVIISTPAAETSITIDTLKYCIDTGLRNEVTWYPQGFTAVLIKPISRDMANQRKGRIGRVDEGHWYPIYTEQEYMKMQESVYSQIITTEISAMILSLLVRINSVSGALSNTHKKNKEGLSILSNEDNDGNGMMEMPPGDNVAYSLNKLYLIGAIDQRLQVTPMGNLINRFRKLRLENAKMILAGYHYGANILDLITIAAMLNNQKVLMRKYKPREILSKQYMEYFVADTFIDLLLLFNSIRDIIQSKKISAAKTYCEENNVSYSEFLSVISARDELLEDIVAMVGFNPLYNGLNLEPTQYNLNTMLLKTPDIAVDEITKIKKCIYSGFLCNMATLCTDESGAKYYTTKTGQRLSQFPPGEPRHFIYDDLIFMQQFGTYTYTYNYYSVIDGFYEPDLGI